MSTEPQQPGLSPCSSWTKPLPQLEPHAAAWTETSLQRSWRAVTHSRTRCLRRSTAQHSAAREHGEPTA